MANTPPSMTEAQHTSICDRLHIPHCISHLVEKRREKRLHKAVEALEWVEDEVKRGRHAVWDAHEYVETFIRSRWEIHWDYTRVDCTIPMAELRALGRLERNEGVRACMKLVRVPVIFEEIAIALWEKLAEEERVTVAAAKFDKDSSNAPVKDDKNLFKRTLTRSASVVSLGSRPLKKRDDADENRPSTAVPSWLKELIGPKQLTLEKEERCIWCGYPGLLCPAFESETLIGELPPHAKAISATGVQRVLAGRQRTLPWLRRGSTRLVEESEEESFWKRPVDLS